MNTGKSGPLGPRVGTWVVRYVLLAGATGATLPALAEDFSYNSPTWGDFQFSWNNRLTVGAAVRVEGRNYNIIDKQNVPGQHLLCATTPANANPGLTTTESDCHSVFGDPALSQALIKARGGYNINGDQGDLNYGPGDITYSGVSLRSTLGGSWRNYSFKLGAIGIYDPVNSHFNTAFRDLPYPGPRVIDANGNPVPDPSNTDNLGEKELVIQRPTRRSSSLETDAGRRLQLLEAYVSGDFTPWEGHKLRLAVGNQYLRWGESTFVLFNGLNQINPLSAPLYRFPGSEVKDAFLPTNLVSASFDLAPKLTLSGFYQLTWEPTQPDVAGSYMSFSNVAGADQKDPIPVYLSQGNTPVDPYGEFVPGPGDSSFTTGSRTAYLQGDHRPHNGGQFGFRLDYYADWLNGGTEFSAYGMSIHSRLPFYSADASLKSCFNPYATPTGLGTYADGLAGCKALYGLDPTDPTQEAEITKNYSYPINSVRPFLEYPEDIHIFGTSFNTTVGNWSLAGELTYSPNQPAQINVVDVTYAALQPAFPDTDPTQERLFETPVPGTFQYAEYPTNRIFIPDYVETEYRHHKVQAGDYVQGYERLEVGQIDLTGIRIFSGSNWIHANQITFVGEVAATKVFNMPSIDQLQFEGFTGRELHYGGVAQSDFNPNAPYAGTPSNFYADRLINPLDVANPEHAKRKDFASSFAWGYRFRLNAAYDDVWRGIGMTPGVDFYHDVGGTSIAPGQDFVEGRIQATFSNEFKFTQNLTSLVRYVLFAGAGYRNVREDRDYAEWSVTYSF